MIALLFQSNPMAFEMLNNIACIFFNRGGARRRKGEHYEYCLR